MSIERELKLTFPAEAIRAVTGSPLLRALKQGRARTNELVSTYYDTRMRELEHSGVALRLRSEGGRWIQTVKTAGSASAAVHERGEFEWPVAGPALELSHLASSPLARQFKDIDARALLPVLTTRFTRTAFLVASGELRAEVAIDRGTIEVGTRQAPIHEIEVELRQGPVSALYDIAMQLAAELPLRPELASKAERGFALRDRRALRPVRARAIELDAEMPVVDAAQRIIGACLTLMQVNERGFLERSDVEFLHQLRVGMRRLRVALACFRDRFDAAELEAIKEELRWLGTQLGPSRDWDVWCTQTLPAIAGQFAADLPIGPLLQGSRAMQRKARAVARQAIHSPRYVLLLLRIGRALAAMPPIPNALPDETLPRFAARLIGKRNRALVGYGEDTAMQRPAAGHDPAALHVARIAAKKLRYTTEFFAALHKRKRVRRFNQALSALQDRLGALNDASVARSLLAQLVSASPQRYDAATIARIEGWLAGNTSARLESLSHAWQTWLDLDRYW